ncbi:hypothetical protein F5883DRAFT_607715 [Diaporthe sp. PMI_573]|nr:hypothetical protein F5883DRAFT_607715 [Diaporthaceae sp. PMI_573]
MVVKNWETVNVAQLFPAGKDDAGAWRLAIVALLAVTGEGFIHEHDQSITSSALYIVPRIMPAPQTLMRPWRPVSLPSERATVTAVYSLARFESLGFFANIIHPLDSLRPPPPPPTVFSFLLTIALIVAGAHWKDGTAMLAIILVSFATSTIGYGPPGDLVIRTREGAFLLIKCSEKVARELYTGAEECAYVVSGHRYRILMVLGAILMMPAVILFGNCTFNMQALVGAAYMILNIIYWSLGLLPRRYHWDLSRYEWEDMTPHDAILATRTTRSGAAPPTPQWKRWLQEAREAPLSGRRTWEAVTTKDRILKESPHNLD